MEHRMKCLLTLPASKNIYMQVRIHNKVESVDPVYPLENALGEDPFSLECRGTASTADDRFARSNDSPLGLQRASSTSIRYNCVQLHRVHREDAENPVLQSSFAEKWYFARSATVTSNASVGVQRGRSTASTQDKHLSQHWSAPRPRDRRDATGKRNDLKEENASSRTIGSVRKRRGCSLHGRRYRHERDAATVGKPRERQSQDLAVGFVELAQGARTRGGTSRDGQQSREKPAARLRARSRRSRPGRQEARGRRQRGRRSRNRQRPSSPLALPGNTQRAISHLRREHLSAEENSRPGNDGFGSDIGERQSVSLRPAVDEPSVLHRVAGDDRHESVSSDRRRHRPHMEQHVQREEAHARVSSQQSEQLDGHRNISRYDSQCFHIVVRRRRTERGRHRAHEQLRRSPGDRWVERELNSDVFIAGSRSVREVATLKTSR